MANAFNLTAQINIRGPANVNKVVSGIQKQLNGLNANVNLGINRNTTKTLAAANKQLQAINVNLNKVAGSATKANASMAQFAKSANSLGGTGNVAAKINSASKATQQLGKNAKISFKDIKLARTEIEEFGRQSALAIRRFTAFASVTSVIYGVNNAINRALGDFVKFDRQLVRISQVSGQAVSNLKGLQGTIGDLATSIGVSSSSLAEISVTLTQAGFSIREVQKALKALALTDVAPTFNNLNQTVEGSIALLRQFSIGAGQLEASLGSINAVAARFAVESSDIIAAIQRAGGVFAAASRGVSEGTDALNEFIAVFTAVRSTTREGAETIATGLRTIFTRLQRESTIDALKEFGVSLQDAQGKFVGAFKAVQLLSEGLGSLDPRDIRFSKIVEELGGFRQIGKVIPLIGQFATAQKALTVAQQGQGSLAESNAKAQAALAIQFARVREEFLRLVRDVAGTDSFRSLVTGALNLASALIKVADSVKGIVPILGLFAAARGASAITQFTRGFGGGLRRTQGFASGGTVPGSGNTDSVPAMLTPGEFVLRKSAVRSIGTEKLHKMNKFGSGDKVNTSNLLKRSSLQGITTFKSNFDSLNRSRPGIWTGRDQLFLNNYTEKYIDPSSKKVPKGLRNKYTRNLNNPQRRGEIFEEIAASQTRRRRSTKSNAFLDLTNAEVKSDKSHGQGRRKTYLTTLVKAFNSYFSTLKNRFTSGIDQISPAGGFQMLLDKRIAKGPKKQATGGSIQDTVPAMLTPGEFVMNKKSAQAVGYGNLRKMNTRPQGFNKGGVVGFNTGGLAAMRGRDSGINLGGFTAQLAGLENAFASMGAPVDQLTNAVMKNGKVSYNSYKALIRQAKANIDLARSSAKTSDDLKKVAAMEKQLMAIRRKGAAQARGGGGVGAGLVSAFDPQNMFYFTAALGTASVALESFDTAVTTGIATTINSLVGFGLTISTAIQTFSAVSTALQGTRVAALAANLGLGGLAATLGPFALIFAGIAAAVAGGIAVFEGFRAAAKKRLEQETKLAQTGLDTATEKTAKALEKLSKQASTVNFQEAVQAAANQAGASDRLAATTLKGVTQNRQDVQAGSAGVVSSFLREAAASLTFGYVDSLQDAADNNVNRAREAAKKLADIYGKQAAVQLSIATERFNAGFTLADLSGAAAKRRGGGTLSEQETINANAFDALVEARLKSDEIYIQSQIEAAESGRQLTTVEIDTHRKRVRSLVNLSNSEASLASKVAESARAQERARIIAYQLAKNFVTLNNKIQASANIIDAESQARQTSIESLAAIAEGSLKIAEVADRASIALNNLAGATPQERQRALTATRNNLTSVLGRDQANEITALSGLDVNSLQSGVEDVISRTPVNKLSGAIQAQLSSDVDAQLGPGASAATKKRFKEISDSIATQIENDIQVLDPASEDYDIQRQNIIDKGTEKLNEALEKTTNAARETATTINDQLNKALNNFASNLNQAAALEAKAQELRYAGIRQQESNNNRISQIMTRESSVTPSSIAARGRNEALALAGTADPNRIGGNILAGSARIAGLRKQLDKSTDQEERKRLIEEIDKETRSINNNRKALDVLAESTQEVIDALIEEAETRSALQDANKQFADTLLTSGPAELKALDESLVRANQRLNGFIPQAGASERKKFFELLKSTGSVRQAQQGVAADMRKTDLQTLDQTRASRELLLSNQIFQRLIAQGVDKQTASVQAGQEARQRIRQDDANIYAQMGREAGLGVLGQQIVGAATATMFDPRNDPVMGALADSLNNQSNQQAHLNTILVDLNKTLAEMTRMMGEDAYRENVESINPARRSMGGLIYASDGQYINFKPKGTDTVPAMLTPGEFVVNRQATQKNMGLLQSINGGRVNTYSGGGKVAYLRGGGFAQRDTNKDGVITIGAEDASGLRDPNGDGRITFAEFMVGTARSPEQQALVNSLSNAVMGRRGGSNTRNFLRAAGTEDMINTFGPMMDDLQAYQAAGVEQFKKDMAEYERIFGNSSAPLDDKWFEERDAFFARLGSNRLAFEFFKDSPGTFNKKITVPSLVKGSMGIYDNTLKEVLENDPGLTADEARLVTLDQLYGKGGVLKPYGNTRAGLERQLERRSFDRTFQGTSLDARKAKVAGDNAVAMARRNRLGRMLRGEKEPDYEQIRHDAEMASLKKTSAAKKRNKLRSFESGRGADDLEMSLTEQKQLGITSAEYSAAQAKRQAQIQKELLDPSTERGQSEAGFDERSKKREADIKARVDKRRREEDEAEAASMEAFQAERAAERAKEREAERIADLERKYGPETVARIRQEQQEANDKFDEEFGTNVGLATSGQMKARILREEQEAEKAAANARMQARLAQVEKDFVERQKREEVEAEARAREIEAQQKRQDNLDFLIAEANQRIKNKINEINNLKLPYETAMAYLNPFDATAADDAEITARKVELDNIFKAKYALMHLKNPEKYDAPNLADVNEFLNKEGFNPDRGIASMGRSFTTTGEYDRIKEKDAQHQKNIDLGYDMGMVVPRALSAVALSPLAAFLLDTSATYAASGKDTEDAAVDAGIAGAIELGLSQISPVLGKAFKQIPFEALTKNRSFANAPGIKQFGDLIQAASTRAAEVSAERSAGNLARNQALGKALQQGLGRKPTANEVRAFASAYNAEKDVAGAIAYVKQYATPRADGLASDMAGMLSQPVEDPVNAMLRDLGVPTTSSGTSQITEATQATRLQALREGGLEAFDATTPTNRMPQSFKQAPPPVGAPIEIPGVKTVDDLPDPRMPTSFTQAPPANTIPSANKPLQIGTGSLQNDIAERIARGEGYMDGGKFVPGKPPVDAGPADDILQRISRGEGYMDGGQFVPGKPPVDAGPAAPLQSSLTSADRGAQAKQILNNVPAASRTEAETAIVNQAMTDPDILKNMRKGGIVYASNGMLVPYRPQGTDTVPAMLTPGEFVVNRNATSQYLPVLRAINSGYNTHGQMVNHLARGGVAGSPQYLQNGGLTGLAGSIMNNGVSVNSQIGGLEELKTVVNQLNEAISGGTENMTNVATQISNTSQSLASGAQSLNEAGTNIPTQITQQQRLTVDHAGIPQNIGAEFGKAADYAIGQADSRSAQQLNDLNTANEGSLGLPPPNNNSTIR